MSTRNITDTISDALVEATAEYAPAIIVNGFREAAGKTEDKTASAILEVMASFVERNGRDGIEVLGNEISIFIQGRSSISVLNDKLSAAELTMLVNGFQNAEAEHRRQYALLAEGMGSLVARFGRIVVDAAARNVMGSLK